MFIERVVALLRSQEDDVADDAIPAIPPCAVKTLVLVTVVLVSKLHFDTGLRMKHLKQNDEILASVGAAVVSVFGRFEVRLVEMFDWELDIGNDEFSHVHKRLAEQWRSLGAPAPAAAAAPTPVPEAVAVPTVVLPTPRPPAEEFVPRAVTMPQVRDLLEVAPTPETPITPVQAPADDSCLCDATNRPTGRTIRRTRSGSLGSMEKSAPTEINAAKRHAAGGGWLPAASVPVSEPPMFCRPRIMRSRIRTSGTCT